jgi:predicted ATPase
VSTDTPDLFGRFTLLGVLGEGGMGTVYRAAIEGPSGFRKELALKVLRRDDTRDPERRAAGLAKEARIGALLRHPNLVDLYDYGVHEGQPWFSMELVFGRGLDQVLLQDAPLAPVRAVQLLAQIALALAAIHELEIEGAPAGLVHRDLKPANVLLTRDDHIKVADFGISRGQHELIATQTESIRGTPSYMSPEQARESDVSAQSDLFALGLIGWELVTGHRFLRGTTIFEVMFSLLQVEDRLDEVRALDGELPGLGSLLADCLREDPAKRPSSARALRGRLLALELRQSSVAPPAWAATTVGAEVVDEATESPTVPGGNLRAGLDAFVGRDVELRALRAAVDEPGRVVSVLGPGGTGKTRLVRELGLGLAPEFPGGVWFIDLTEARTFEGVCADVARVLDIPLARGAADPAARIGAALSARGRALLLLDNFEQVAVHGPKTVGAWAERCPQVRFVVTTRQRLGLRNEQLVRLGPLSTQYELDLPIDQLKALPAVQLFVERARARRPSFDLTADNAATVAELVRALEGIPLAIELAAARIRVLSPARLLERLPERFELLSTGRTDVTGRQATLKATIEWSWALLEPWEQAGLAQSSVFRGGFTAEAAEAVLDLSAWPDAPWLLDVVEALEDKSLLRSVEAESGEMRFVHFESIREFALEKLSELGQADVAERRHMEWYAARGSVEGIASLFTQGSTARRRRLREDLENLAAAAERALGIGEPGMACGATLAAVTLLNASGPLNLACGMLDDVLAADLEGIDRARVLIARGRIRGLQAENDPSEADYRAAAALAADAGDVLLEARAWSELGRLRAYSPEGGQTAMLERSLTVARGQGDRLLEARVLCSLAIRDAAAGRFQEARSRNEVALQIVKRTGDRHGELIALGNLAVAYKELSMGVLELATLNEARRLARELGAGRQEAVLLINLGVHHHVHGRLAQAEALYTDALSRSRDVGFFDLEEVSLANLGDVLYDRGLLGDAERVLREALDRSDAGGQLRFRPAILGMLGLALVDMDRLDEADVILTEAEEVAPALGNPRHAGEVGTWRAAWHRKRGELDEARDTLSGAEDLLRDLPEVRFALRARIERVELSLAGGDATGAIAHADAIIDEVRGIHDPLLLARLLAARGRAEQAAGRRDAVAATAMELSDTLDGVDVVPAAAVRRTLRELRA